MVRDLRDEELDDAIDMEIEKVRRTTYRTDFSEGSLSELCAGPRGSVCGELTDPGSDARDASPGRASQSSISHSGSEAGQNMVAHSPRQRILSGVRIEPMQTPHAMLAQGGKGRGGSSR